MLHYMQHNNQPRTENPMIHNPMSGEGAPRPKRKTSVAGNVVRIVLGGIGALIVLLLFFGCVGAIVGADSDGQQPAETVAAAPSPEPSETPVAPIPAPEPDGSEPEDPNHVEPEATEEPEAVETPEPVGVERCDIAEPFEIEDEWQLWVTYDARDAFTRGTRVLYAQEDTAMCLEAAYLAHPSVDWIYVEGTIPGTNAYGEETLVTWTWHSYQIEAVERIDFETIQLENIWPLATSAQLYQDLT